MFRAIASVSALFAALTARAVACNGMTSTLPVSVCTFGCTNSFGTQQRTIDLGLTGASSVSWMQDQQYASLNVGNLSNFSTLSVAIDPTTQHILLTAATINNVRTIVQIDVVLCYPSS